MKFSVVFIHRHSTCDGSQRSAFRPRKETCVCRSQCPTHGTRTWSPPSHASSSLWRKTSDYLLDPGQLHDQNYSLLRELGELDQSSRGQRPRGCQSLPHEPKRRGHNRSCLRYSHNSNPWGLKKLPFYGHCTCFMLQYSSRPRGPQLHSDHFNSLNSLGILHCV